ncbi:histidine kinase [Solirubrobacter taibaiensis]|nr:histidine kinase [Solirubrobacter taibaiensis]
MRREEHERLPRLTASAVLAISALLVVVEVWRIALLDSAAETAFAAAAALAFFPLHARHLRYGLRGERPPHALATLAAMAAVHIAALAVIGPAWSFMLATLAVSALIVLPVRWALVAAAACALGPVAANALHPGEVAANGDTVQYLVVSVVFRSLLQFALVWLVTATHELMRSRTALAEAATERERARIEGEVRTALELRAERLRHDAHTARAALADPGQAPVLVALDRVLELSRDALSDVRRIVAGARLEPAAAAEELARSARGADAPIRAAARIAWLPALAVQLVVVGYNLALVLGVWTEAEPGWSAPVSLALVGTGIALYTAVALPVAHGHAPRYGWPIAAALALLSVAAAAFGDDLWGCLPWLAIAAAALVAGDRWAPHVILASVTALSAFMTVRYWGELSPLGPGTVAWCVLYWIAIGGLAAIALVASVRFVAVVAELDRTRDALAREAANAERRRLSSDVHDMLGHSLTAISLKADLARRLLAADRDGAARELDDLLVLADQQNSELAAVAGAARAVGFEAEATAAIGLLRSAGITVEADLAPGPLTPEASTALGWAVREAATNILRHARARNAWITAAADERGCVLVEVVNDGAPATPGLRGTGLAALAERASACGGRAEAGPVGGGRFRVRIELPVAVLA